MTPRDRRALIVGGVVVMAAAFVLRVLPPVLRGAGRSYAELRERTALLGRTRAQLGSLPELRDSAGVVTQALVALAPQVLSGATAAEAGADLSGRMSLAASRAPARVDRIDLLPDSVVGGRLHRTRVHAAFETDVRGLIAFLRAIDSGAEVLMLDELRVMAPDPGAPERGPELLKVEVTVSGWYIAPRSRLKAQT